MVYPWLKLSAKLVDENDAIDCRSAGIYYIVFSNKHSWLQSRVIDASVLLSNTNTKGENSTQSTKRIHIDGTQTEEATPSERHFPTLFHVSNSALSWHVN